MNRGSSMSLRRCASVPGSFNEAPIHESGKCFESGHECVETRGFNEAPIHESGKY